MTLAKLATCLLAATAFIASASPVQLPADPYDHAPSILSNKLFAADHGLIAQIAPTVDVVISDGIIRSWPERAPNLSRRAVEMNTQDSPLGGDLGLEINLDREKQKNIVEWIEAHVAKLRLIQDYVFARGWAPIIAQLLPDCHITAQQVEQWVFDLMSFNLDFNDLFHAIGGEGIVTKLMATEDLDADKVMEVLERHQSLDKQSSDEYLKNHSWQMSDRSKKGEEGKYRLAYFLKAVGWNLTKKKIKSIIEDVLKNGIEHRKYS
jgi:hypothetical protein